MSRTTRSVVALSSSAILALVGVGLSVPSSSANGLAPPGCGESFSGGAGTTADPFLISSAADFTALNGDSNCWSGEFLQTANIDMGGAEWSIGEPMNPASTTGTDAAPFSGTYDGNRFHISGLTIDRGDSLGDDNGGLFGVVTGTIRNLGFIDSDLSTKTVSADDVAGGLVGSLRGGTVSNSYATVYVWSDNDYAGGLVGEAFGGATIEDSYSAGIVEGDENYVGGLVGALDDSASVVRGSHSTATVTGGEDETGGLIGYLDRARVVNSYATGDVTGVQYVGGLVGSANGTASISGAYATGNVGSDGTAGKYVGGLIGVVEADASLTDCYATGSVSGGDAGGLISDNGGTVRNCYSTGEVDGDREGGLVLDNTGTVSNSFWDTVTSDQTSSAGGTGKTTSEMKTLETFTDAGWSIMESCDATTIWGLCPTRNSGYPYLTFYTATPSGSPDAQTESLVLTADSGVTCRHSEVTGGRGLWVELPTADDCSVAGKPDARVLGWATRSNFPVEIARRQVDNGWGAYEWSNEEGKVIGVFIPAGGSTFLSNSVRLYPIVEEPVPETSLVETPPTTATCEDPQGCGGGLQPTS